VKNLASLAIFGGDLSAEALLKFHREHPHVQMSARSNGWMGINAFGTPCQIENIVENSAAAQAKLEVGDVVLKINGAEIKDFTELTLAMASQNGGDVVRVGIERDGKRMEIPVKLHARP
jgi:S1-C subfamily serine protease